MVRSSEPKFVGITPQEARNIRDRLRLETGDGGFDTTQFPPSMDFLLARVTGTQEIVPGSRLYPATSYGVDTNFGQEVPQPQAIEPIWLWDINGTGVNVNQYYRVNIVNQYAHGSDERGIGVKIDPTAGDGGGDFQLLGTASINGIGGQLGAAAPLSILWTPPRGSGVWQTERYALGGFQSDLIRIPPRPGAHQQYCYFHLTGRWTIPAGVPRDGFVRITVRQLFGGANANFEILRAYFNSTGKFETENSATDKLHINVFSNSGGDFRFDILPFFDPPLPFGSRFTSSWELEIFEYVGRPPL